MAELDERVARIEGTLEQVHTRLTTGEKDPRDFRSDTILEFRALCTELTAALQRIESRLDQQLERMDARFQQMDARF